VANMQREGLEGHAGNGGDGHQPGRDGADSAGSASPGGQSGSVGDSQSRGRGISASWARFETVLCRDGKTRRFESGSFPLAYGLPGRVGLLRGYGNSIVPQCAAEFIQAYIEIKP
jgi:DNA (cytosine-5)-methyltransferase 1